MPTAVQINCPPASLTADRPGQRGDQPAVGRHNRRCGRCRATRACRWWIWAIRTSDPDGAADRDRIGQPRAPAGQSATPARILIVRGVRVPQTAKGLSQTCNRLSFHALQLAQHKKRSGAEFLSRSSSVSRLVSVPTNRATLVSPLTPNFGKAKLGEMIRPLFGQCSGIAFVSLPTSR